jgi:hypothetical protein
MKKLSWAEATLLQEDLACTIYKYSQYFIGYIIWT